MIERQLPSAPVREALIRNTIWTTDSAPIYYWGFTIRSLMYHKDYHCVSTDVLQMLKHVFYIILQMQYSIFFLCIANFICSLAWYIRDSIMYSLVFYKHFISCTNGCHNGKVTHSSYLGDPNLKSQPIVSCLDRGFSLCSLHLQANILY